MIDLCLGVWERRYHWYRLSTVTAWYEIIHMKCIQYCEHCCHRHQHVHSQYHHQHGQSLQPIQFHQPHLLLDRHVHPHHCYHQNNWHIWGGRSWSVSHNLLKSKSTCNPVQYTLPTHHPLYNWKNCGSSHVLNAIYSVKHRFGDSEPRWEHRVCFAQWAWEGQFHFFVTTTGKKRT